jgi:hypothetical protein
MPTRLLDISWLTAYNDFKNLVVPEKKFLLILALIASFEAKCNETA